MDVFVLSGFVVGLVGSLHCLGMCGPIVLALPGSGTRGLGLLFGRLLYNLGRAVTYAVLGVLCGLIGKTVAMAGFQQTMSIVAGVAILAFAFIPGRLITRLTNGLSSRAVSRMTSWWGTLFSKSSAGSLFVIGLLNGLLPCGLVYVALGASVATGSPTDAAIYMALFGLGTLPAMFVASTLGSLLGVSVRRKLAKLLPIGAVVLATLLILRGLSLGIPYISPVLSPNAAETAPCCHGLDS